MFYLFTYIINFIDANALMFGVAQRVPLLESFGNSYVSVFISFDLSLFIAINLSCVILNVRGLNNERKRRQVFRGLPYGQKF